MPLSYILTQLGNKMGLNRFETNDRNTLLRFINEAAVETYDQCDMPGSLMEQVFQVNGDQSITFPSNVGRIRAIREYASMQAWHINQMRPRYNQFNWSDMWRNYRIKYDSATMVSVINESVGVLSVPKVENPPIVISLSGPTSTASLINEQVIMDATQKVTQNAFSDYTSLKKNVVNSCDVTLSDVDETLISIIPNNMLEAKYQLVDVSLAPWLPVTTTNLDNYMEVLYKRSLPVFVNDDDEFPGFNYDNILVNKSMQLWAEEQEKIEQAGAYDSKATRSMARKQEDNNRETEDKVALVANPHDTVLKRIGTGLRRRYSLYAGRRY